MKKKKKHFVGKQAILHERIVLFSLWEM